MAVNSLKTVVAFFDDVLQQMNDDFTYAGLVDVETINPGTMQNANDIYWRNVEQQRPIIEGRDLTGLETGTIEQGYPLRLEAPKNDFMEYNIQNLRDEGFMRRAAVASAKKQNAYLNKRIAELVASTGTLTYESSAAGFDFVAEADTLMTERGCYRGEGSTFFLNPRTNQVMASDLASRSDLSGRPEGAYATAMIGKNVAGFDVYRAPTYGTILQRVNATGGTVAADVTEVPEGYVSAGVDSIQNVDYRVGSISVGLAEGANFQVGDVITVAGVNALNLMDKTDTGELMTFRVVAIDGDNLSVYPKPIAADQAGITTEQAAYANISTAIVTGMAVAAANVTGGQANSFWANDSICVVNGDEPFELLNEFDGMKVVSETLDNGVKLYMGYDANLATVNARVRLFTRWGLVNKDPSRNGNAIYTG